MPDAYTRISKPTDSTYAYVNPQGRQVFDDVNLTYDDASAFYDSINAAAYTMVTKPTGEVSVTIPKGTTTGLLIPFTYATDQTAGTSAYTKIPKPLI